VLVPIAILLSLILPGNRVILFADLAVIPFVVAMFAPLMRGNIVRMVIAGTLELLVGFYLATWMSPFFTATAVEAGFAMPENALSITSIADGFIWTPALFVKLVEYTGAFGLVILAALLGVAMFFYMKNSKAWEIAAGAPEE
jgi:PTS system galactitol-specific IIC component